MTVSGEDTGSSCYFPFKVTTSSGPMTYVSCADGEITSDLEHGRKWCSTKVESYNIFSSFELNSMLIG